MFEKMKIKTITCHDVYNAGASLQAYALMKYLTDAGHQVEIIDYKPDYLSRHYSLRHVSNPRFDKPFVRQAYLVAKLPSRLKDRKSQRKKNFDCFKKEYLAVTKEAFHSNEDLMRIGNSADLFIAGSDQIWNPLFRNGRDPAFFLQFVSDKKMRFSYAASFSVDVLPNEDKMRMTKWLQGFQSISVREKSAVSIVESMGLSAVQVCDPVFLLMPDDWKKIAVTPLCDSYIFVYDFDGNPRLWKKVKEYAARKGKKILSVFHSDHADMVLEKYGPREFVGAVMKADMVISNSFHATAFSLIFHKPFYVTRRNEQLNTRMTDLLADIGLQERFLDVDNGIIIDNKIDWITVEKRLDPNTKISKQYLDKITQWESEIK